MPSTGRTRIPYAAALPDLYTGVMSHDAFDFDFTSPGLLDVTQEEKVGSHAVVTYEPVITPTAADQPTEPTASQIDWRLPRNFDAIRHRVA
jgi:hypothetical protein